MMKSSFGQVSIGLMVLLSGCVVRVAQPAPVVVVRHPPYLQAIQDLRHARAQLERPAAVTAQTAWDENVALREIDGAIQEAQVAAAEDGKNVGALPPLALAPDWSGRLHRTLELLEAARRNVTREEDNLAARGHQGRAVQHLDAAINFVRQGLANNAPVVVVQPPPPPQVVYVPVPAAQHPPYLHALEDLRFARAYLQRTATVTRAAAWDESVAIGEIDAALHEIRQAAIDDGKNLNEHPPIDARLDWRGRLHHTLELLRKARQDVSHREDNPAAQGLQQRAVHHIDGAINFVEQGIAANH